MKRIYYIYLYILAIFINSCNKYEQPTPEYALPGFTTNVKSHGKINIGELYAFRDLSKGVTNRIWSFDNEVKFIQGNEKSEFIEVTFTKPGECKMNLHSEFIDTSIKLDTTIILDVLDSIKADFRVSYLEHNNIEPIGNIEFEAGETVHFTSTSIGRPLDYTWILDGSDEGIINCTTSFSNNETIEIDAHYYIPGIYDVKLIASRNDPWGNDTLLVKDFIKVLPTEKKGDIISVEQTIDEKLLVSCSLPIDETTINNEAFDIKRNGTIVNTKSVSISNISPTKILIDIEDGAWNGDEILLTYKGGIKTAMGTELNTCSDIPFIPYKINLIANGDFEKDILPVVYDDWNIIPNGECTISSEQHHSGKNSLHIKNNGNVVKLAIRSGEDVDFVIKPNVKYMFEYWYYSITNQKWSQVGLQNRNPYVQLTTAECWMDGTQDKWVKIEKEFSYNGSIETTSVYWHFDPLNGFDAYIDDIAVYEYKRHE